MGRHWTALSQTASIWTFSRGKLVVIRNLKRRIARRVALFVFMAVGVVPIEIRAAALDTNLLVDPGFENVDLAVGGTFGSVKLIDWTGLGSSGNGFAYNYAQNYDNRFAGFVPPDNDPASSEDFYFNGGSSGDGSIGGVYQDVDLSTGPSAAAIAHGDAQFTLYGWFSSYLTQGDFGNLKVEFFDAGGTSLGSHQVSDSDVSQWTIEVVSDLIPSTTSRARVSAFGTAVSGEPDGYIDEISFSVSGVPEPASITALAIGLTSLVARRKRRN